VRFTHGITYSKDSTLVRSHLGFRHTKEGLMLVPIAGHKRRLNEKETPTREAVQEVSLEVKH